MALTEFQIKVLRLLRSQQDIGINSYFAGGAALNHVLGTPRLSKDIDLFHDTTEALIVTWNNDKQRLINNGYVVEIERESASYIEAKIVLGQQTVLIQWARDSAFRFFPLIEDALFGKTLHPFDLATNKLLAMAGRLEPRDWVDTIECHRHIQPLGFLIWSASGKDPGINPEMLIADAARLHYSQQEINMLDFKEEVPTASVLSQEWKTAIETAKTIVNILPDEHIGECILTRENQLFRGSKEEFQKDYSEEKIIFHTGSIGGVLPRIIR